MICFEKKTNALPAFLLTSFENLITLHYNLHCERIVGGPLKMTTEPRSFEEPTLE